MFWCLVRLSSGALSGGLYAIPFEMAIQSAVACSEAKDDGLLVLWQLMECILVWVLSSSLAVEEGFLFVMDKMYVMRRPLVTSRHHQIAATVCAAGKMDVHVFSLYVFSYTKQILVVHASVAEGLEEGGS